MSGGWAQADAGGSWLMDSRRREIPAHSAAATPPRSGQRRARDAFPTETIDMLTRHMRAIRAGTTTPPSATLPDDIQAVCSTLTRRLSTRRPPIWADRGVPAGPSPCPRHVSATGRVSATFDDAAGEPCVTNFRRVKLRVVTLATDPLTRRH